MDFKNRLFAASAANFNELAVELFNYQYQSNGVYRQYCDALKINTDAVDSLQKIPFLPISFFKTHKVTSGGFEGGTIFESSGTTGSVNSKHYVKDLDLYRESFTTCFEKFYGPPRDKCILGLLPSYLERKNSSLVMMVESLIAAGENPLSGFYLYDHEKLHRTLMHNELLKISTLLIGVTYALLDFAEKYPRKWVLYDTKIKDFSFKFFADNKKAQVLIDIEHRNDEKRIVYFEKLESLKTILEDDFVKDLVFEKNFTLESGKTISRIWIEKTNISISNRNHWNEIFDFFYKNMHALEMFYFEYGDYIRDLETNT